VDVATLDDALDPTGKLGIDRLLAFVRLRKAAPGAFVRIFRVQCANCGGNHYQQAATAVRIAQEYVHPAAVAELRRAGVPLRALLAFQILNDPREHPPPTMCGLPVFLGDRRRTSLAQRLWAARYALAHRGQTPDEREKEAAIVRELEQQVRARYGEGM
jgi:hypothetical protein